MVAEREGRDEEGRMTERECFLVIVRAKDLN